MVSGPSLSGGFFDDEQHRFGPNDLLQAPQRTTKPLGWQRTCWQWSKTAGRTFNNFLGHIAQCAQMLGKYVWTCFDRCRAHACLRILTSRAFTRPSPGSVRAPKSSNLVADREVSLGGLGGTEFHGHLDIGCDEGDEGVYLGVDQCEPCGPCPS